MNKPLPNKLWPFIWHFLSRYKPSIVLFILLAMTTGIWSPLNSLLIKHIIDSLSDAQHGDVSALIFWPAIFFVLNFELHNLCWRVMGYINYKMEPVIKNQIISETFEYIHKHTPQFFSG